MKVTFCVTAVYAPETKSPSRNYFRYRHMRAVQPHIGKRFTPDMVVLEETIAHYIKDRFLAEEASAIADDVIAAVQLRGLDLTELGITREELESRILAKSESSTAKGTVIEQPVQPQKERQVARQRLDERVKSGAKELLNELSISVIGRDLPRRFPQIGATNNLGAAIVLLNMQVQEFLGLGSNERDIATTEELKRAHDSMDTIIDAVAVKFRSK